MLKLLQTIPNVNTHQLNNTFAQIGLLNAICFAWFNYRDRLGVPQFFLYALLLQVSGCSSDKVTPGRVQAFEPIKLCTVA